MPRSLFSPAGLALAGLLAVAAGPAPAADGLRQATTPFDARFNVTKSGLGLGTTHFSLRPADQPNCYIYRGRAEPNALVGMFLGDIDDRSHFCVVDGQIRPMRFSHSENGAPRKSYSLDFDWTEKIAHYKDQSGREKTFPIAPGVQDPMSLHIAARAWVADAIGQGDVRAIGERPFRLADDDGVEDFRLTTESGGTVSTPSGRYDTLRVTRTGKHSNPLSLWLAADAHWIPIQVRTGSGGRVFTMKATSLSSD